ncbi:MAG TPA: hypothetical protein DCE41_14100, partial [Cytophagales bacterium]|nr:hypothetical protein [Cytophagales bacterium]
MRILEITSYLKRPERILTVHSGVDPARFATPPPHTWLHERFAIPKRTPLIGNASALEASKDYHTFLETAAQLHRQGLDAHYILLGEGPQRSLLKQRAETLGLAEQVHFTGYLHQLDTILPELEVLLMPSREEGLGTAILDAYAARVPVVATRTGGIPEMVRHEHTGLLADVGQPKQLAQQVMRILGDQ